MGVEKPVGICTICRKYDLCKITGKAGTICSEFKAEKAQRKKPTHDESLLQQECKRRFDSAYPALAPLFFAVPNGADVSDGQRKKLSAEGLTAGVADTILLVPSADGRHHCLCIEFKRKTFKVLKSGKLSEDHGRQSQEQKDWQKAIESAGGRYEVVWDVDTFKEIIVNHLGYDNFSVTLKPWQKQ